MTACLLLPWVCPAQADVVSVVSGKISAEGGVDQSSGKDLKVYQFSRLLLQYRADFSPSWSLSLAGEALWQSSSGTLFPSWPVSPERNLVDFEGDDGGDSTGSNFKTLRLDRANLKWTSGPLEATAGLQSFHWGSSHFYRPTDYFSPLLPLQWEREELLGSEGLDASCFLFDDLSLEGAARWFSGGEDEWVMRLVNKGIGITATPSFARLSGRDGLGLELSGTFPDFQLRWEGVDWLYSSSGAAGPSALLEWVAGISTVKKGIDYTLEVFRDETGAILGQDSAGAVRATYLFTSMEKTLPGEWKAAPALLKGFEGGPFLFWPKLSWGFLSGWELEAQGQFRIGTVPGPLALVPNRLGASISYIF